MRRGTTPPARCRAPEWPGGPCRRLDGGRRGRSTRSWGADAPLARAGWLPDRAPRLVGRRRPSPRSPATTRSSRPAHGTRCMSGRDPKDPWRQGTPMCEPLGGTLPRGSAIPRTGRWRAPLAGPRVLPMPAFRDDFDGDALDPAVWDPHYLPAWSSRTATAARHRCPRAGSGSGSRPTSRCGAPTSTPLRCASRASPPGATPGPVGEHRGRSALPRRPAGARAAASLRGLAAHAGVARRRLPDGALGPRRWPPSG